MAHPKFNVAGTYSYTQYMRTPIAIHKWHTSKPHTRHAKVNVPDSECAPVAPPSPMRRLYMNTYMSMVISYHCYHGYHCLYMNTCTHMSMVIIAMLLQLLLSLRSRAGAQ